MQLSTQVCAHWIFLFYFFFYPLLQAFFTSTAYKGKWNIINCAWVPNYSHYQSSVFTLTVEFITFLMPNVFFFYEFLCFEYD